MTSRRNVTIAVVCLAVWCVAAVSADEKKPGRLYVRMTTSAGDFVLELNRDKAPITVDNFLSYVDDGFYNGTVFHRVVPNFVVQGGGMTLNPDTFKFEKKATKPPIKNEATNGLKNDYGTIAMARTANPHSATSQFYINVKDNNSLNHPRGRGWGYCVFGKVIDGMDTVETIHAHGATEGEPDGVVVIKKAVRVDPKEVKGAIAAARAAEAAAEKQKAAARAKAMEQAKKFLKDRGVDPSGGTVTASGLWVLDVKTGAGASPVKTDTVEVDYTGWLPDGTKFDSSHDRGQTATFPLNGVIAGWTEGVGGMKVGGKRYLIIPPELAYGDRAMGRHIKPGSTLVFEVDLLNIVKK